LFPGFRVAEVAALILLRIFYGKTLQKAIQGLPNFGTEVPGSKNGLVSGILAVFNGN
jgi:hypothetical protein